MNRNYLTLPEFSKINFDEVEAQVENFIEIGKNQIEELVNNPPELTWENVIKPLEEKEDKFDKMWSPIGHMNAVVSSDRLREVYEACLPKLSEYATWAGQHQGYYNLLVELEKSDDAKSWNAEQKESLRQTIRDFTLSGIGLEKEKQKRFGEISSKLSELSAKFSNNVLDATMGWTKLITDKNQLKGLPESAILMAQEEAKAKGETGYLLTLNMPSYLPVLTYCENQELRKEMYEAFATRASEVGVNGGKWDNSEIIEAILVLRQEKAELLNFETHAHKSLATKMAPNTEQVFDFLNDLATKAKPQGEVELAELKAFAKAQYGVDTLNLWDIGYYSEKQKEHLFDISDEALRAYFPEDRALSGLFEVVNRLFGMEVVERSDVDTWHKDVRFFDIFDETGSLRGAFYLDLYARDKKRGGAWMNECQVRRKKESGMLQVPVAYLTCNFNGPVGGKPALFTHREVVTLFHEFGHGIHHMLTQVEVAGVSGINGVPWDAVELPSQFLENWCWEEEALEFISGHYETGKPLPKAMLDNMLKAKNYQSAMGILRQLEFGLFDFTLHSKTDVTKCDQVKALSTEIKNKVSVLPQVDWARQSHSFSHIFAGGYSAGYYSYLWAEVLSADAFSKFEEDGIFNKETGRSFLHNILEKGGSASPMDLFKNFRGREPQVDALLRHSGIKV